MNIPVWLLELVVTAIGVIGFFAFKHVMQLIQNDRKAFEEAVGNLNNEMKDLKMELNGRVEFSESKLLEAIEKLSSGLVPMVHCSGKQEVWKERFENILKVIETAQITRAEADQAAHANISQTMAEVSHEVSQLRTVVLNLKPQIK